MGEGGAMGRGGPREPPGGPSGRWGFAIPGGPIGFIGPAKDRFSNMNWLDCLYLLFDLVVLQGGPTACLPSDLLTVQEA